MANSNDRPAFNIEAVDWDDVIPRLLKFAHAKVGMAAARGSLIRVEPADIVQTAIQKMLSGQRPWDGQLNLVGFLCGVIKSEISHLVEKSRGSQGISLSESTESVSDPRLAVPSPEDIYFAMHELQASQTFALEFRDSLPHGSSMQKIVDAIVFEECTKPAEIAKFLNLQVETVYNEKKSIRRRLAEFIQAKRGGDIK